MKTARLVYAGILLSICVATTAAAQSGPETLKAKGCLHCHDPVTKKAGPSFKDIAAKHKGDKGAEAALVARLKDGKDHPKVGASDAELKAAVGHVLSGK